MTLTDQQLTAVRLAAPAIAAARIQEAKVYDPADELKMGLARYLYTRAEDWIDDSGNADPEAIAVATQLWLKVQPKPNRKQRHRIEEVAAARSHYPAALKAAISLIRVEKNLAPNPRSIFLFSVFMEPDQYMVRWRDSRNESHQLETYLPLTASEFYAWKKWRDTPEPRRR